MSENQITDSKVTAEMPYESRDKIYESGEKIGSIAFKPQRQIWTVIIVGIGLIIIFHNLFTFLFGGSLIALGLIVNFYVKDHQVMEVYSDALLLINPENGSQVRKVPLSDVAEWNVNKGGTYSIWIKTLKGEEYSAASFQSRRAYLLLDQVMREKNTGEIIKKRNRENAKGYYGMGSLFKKRKQK